MPVKAPRWRDNVGWVALLMGVACSWGCTRHTDDAEPTFAVEPARETLIAGHEFSCHLERDGEALCWGDHRSASLVVDGEVVTNATQLAIGSTSPESWLEDRPRVDVEPVCVIEAGEVRCDLGTPALGLVSDVALGYSHTCAVLANSDQIACWYNRVPEKVLHHVPGAVEVAVNREHACVLTRSGRVVCWGFEVDCPPRWIVDFGIGVDISARVDTCVADIEGVVRCLAPTSCPEAYPSELTRVLGVENARRVATGYTMNCALAGAKVSCWPVSRKEEDEEEAMLLGEPVEFSSDAKVRDLAVGARHACVRTSSGVECWGSNRDHQLDGPNHPMVIHEPRLVPDLEAVDRIIVGSDQTCARQAGGVVYCWGQRDLPQEWWSGLPRRISRLDGAELFQDRMTGHIGAVTGQHSVEYMFPDESAKDWTDLGSALLSSELNRVERTEFESGWRLLACAISNPRPPVCAVFGDPVEPPAAPQALSGVRDLALCNGRAWLVDVEGSVSLARPVDRAALIERLSPVELPAPATGISCSGFDACALLENGTVACWSDKQYGSTYPDASLVIPLERAAVGMAMGLHSACAWSHDGHVECWGDPEAPSLGFAAPRTSAEVPRTLPGVHDAIQVSVEISHGCVLHAQGGVSCWGDNTLGKVGGGSGGWKNQPVVALP